MAETKVRTSLGGAYEKRGQYFMRITVAPQKRRAEHLAWVTAKAWADHGKGDPCPCAACGRARDVQALINRLREAGKVDFIEKTIEIGAAEDPKQLDELRAFVGQVVGGDILKRRDPTAARTPRSLSKQTETWLESTASLYDEATVRTLKQYAAKWKACFGDNIDAIDGPALARYMAARLSEVTRSTVKKELWGLRAFLTWAVDVAQTLPSTPPFPKLPKRATGVRSGRQRREPVPLTRQDVAALLAALDEITRPPAKDAPRPPGRPRTAASRAAFFRYTFMAETGLRPETLDVLSVPEHYTKGAAALTLTNDADKARWGRNLPLSPKAREALDAVAPKKGPVFGAKRWIETFKQAVATAKLPKQTAPYDLRHAFGTHGVEASNGNLTGVAYLLGHKQVTTTNRYVHSNEQAAEAVLASLRRPVRGGKRGGKKAGSGGSGAPGADENPSDSEAVRRKGLEPLQELPHWNLNRSERLASTDIRDVRGEIGDSDDRPRTVPPRSAAALVGPAAALATAVSALLRAGLVEQAAGLLDELAGVLDRARDA